jgi:hypothetical protein
MDIAKYKIGYVYCFYNEVFFKCDLEDIKTAIDEVTDIINNKKDYEFKTKLI